MWYRHCYCVRCSAIVTDYRIFELHIRLISVLILQRYNRTFCYPSEETTDNGLGNSPECVYQKVLAQETDERTAYRLLVVGPKVDQPSVSSSPNLKPHGPDLSSSRFQVNSERRQLLTTPPSSSPNLNYSLKCNVLNITNSDYLHVTKCFFTLQTHLQRRS